MFKETAEKAFASAGERAAAKFLKDHPELVVWSVCRTGGHSKYVISEFPFGSKFKADFIVPFSYSGAWRIHFIELEPTDDPVITKKGLPSNRLNTAISQINDWREYLEKRPAEFQSDLSDWCAKKDLLKWHDEGELPCNFTGDYLRDPETVFFTSFHIVIGCRATISATERKKMNQLHKGGAISISTYDQYVDIAYNYDRHRANPAESIRLARTDEET